MEDVLYFNGRFTTTDEKVLGVEDRGFQFGDSIYEVIKFIRHRTIFMADHYRRLEQGLGELEIPNPWRDGSFPRICGEVLERTSFDDGILYIQVSRGEDKRAHFYPENLPPTVVIYSRAYEFPDAAKKERGIRLITTPDSRWKFCNVKSVNLLANLLAKKKAQRAGADEALFIENGEVREGASSSFFAVRNGKLLTHPSDPCVLPGTVRDRVISIALAEKIRVDERPVRDDELLTLDEAFITNTTQGVMPVSEIDGRFVGNRRRGPVTSVLQELFDAEEQREIEE